MQEQMMTDLDLKEQEIRTKDAELAECYRTIEALKQGGADEGDLSRELGESAQARAAAEREAAHVRRELGISESLVGIKEDTITKLQTGIGTPSERHLDLIHAMFTPFERRFTPFHPPLLSDLDRALAVGSADSGHKIRALEAEVAGLREALAEALEQVRAAAGEASRAEYRGMGRFKPSGRRPPRPEHSAMRKAPHMIKHHTHRFSEGYVRHILDSC